MRNQGISLKDQLTAAELFKYYGVQFTLLEHQVCSYHVCA